MQRQFASALTRTNSGIDSSHSRLYIGQRFDLGNHDVAQGLSGSAHYDVDVGTKGRVVYCMQPGTYPSAQTTCY